jgi:hypothetical protein
MPKPIETARTWGARTTLTRIAYVAGCVVLIGAAYLLNKPDQADMVQAELKTFQTNVLVCPAGSMVDTSVTPTTPPACVPVK